MTSATTLILLWLISILIYAAYLFDTSKIRRNGKPLRSVTVYGPSLSLDTETYDSLVRKVVLKVSQESLFSLLKDSSLFL